MFVKACGTPIVIACNSTRIVPRSADIPAFAASVDESSSLSFIFPNTKLCKYNKKVWANDEDMYRIESIKTEDTPPFH